MKKISCFLSLIILFMSFFNLDPFVKAQENKTRIEIHEINFEDFFENLESNELMNFVEEKYIFETTNEEDIIYNCLYNNLTQEKVYEEYLTMDEVVYDNISYEDLSHIYNFETIKNVIFQELKKEVTIEQIQMFSVIEIEEPSIFLWVKTSEEIFIIECSKENKDGIQIKSTVDEEQFSELYLHVLTVEEANQKYKEKTGVLTFEDKIVSIKYKYFEPQIPFWECLNKMGICVEKTSLYAHRPLDQRKTGLLLSANSKKIYLYGESEMADFCKYQPARYSFELPDNYLLSILQDTETFIPYYLFKTIVNHLDFEVEEINETTLNVFSKEIYNWNTECLDTIKIFINNVELECEENVEPQMISNRVLVPMRYSLEAMGANIDWDQNNNIAIARKDGIVLEIPIDKNYYTVNGEVRMLDVPAILVFDRTMIPIRAISESMGADVIWENEPPAVHIYTNLT